MPSKPYRGKGARPDEPKAANNDTTMSTPRGRVTMRQVAVAAGVSVQTVSNVVNGRSQHMRAATAERVQEVIDGLGFRPNASARGLRSARTQTLAFLVLDDSPHFLGDPMTDLFLSGLGDELRDASFGLLIRASDPDSALEPLLEPLLDGRVDGAVVLLSGPAELRAAHVRELRTLDSPFLLLQEHVADDPRAPSVCAEDRAGALEVCRHLIAKGHRRIGFLTAAQSWSAIEERILGYRDAHEEAGIPLDPALVHRAGKFKALDAALAAAELLDRHPRPTVIMCANDLVALGVCKAARERRLRVPEDVAVAGFDDFDFAAAIDPPLTTVRIPAYEMGRYAASALMNAVARNVRPEPRTFPTDVLVRGSA